jgi:hypothetical protein
VKTLCFLAFFNIIGITAEALIGVLAAGRRQIDNVWLDYHRFSHSDRRWIRQCEIYKYTTRTFSARLG